MIDNEKFSNILNKVRDNEFLTPTDGAVLIETIAELDANLLIAQNTVEFILASSISQFEMLGSNAVEIMGNRDASKVKKMGKLFGGAAGRLTTAAQLFVQGQLEQAREMLSAFDDIERVDTDDTEDA